ncbi:MAG TPA: hypothetical protein V7792_00980 [Candidatus Azoamicus sp. OHIO2]
MLILSLEYTQKLLSISISNKSIVCYKEIFGQFVSSKYILNFINSILIENKITLNDITGILLSETISNLTSMKIFFSVIQSLSLSQNIPIFQIYSSDALVDELILSNSKKYILIHTYSNIIKKDLYNLYYINKNLIKIILKNKHFQLNHFLYHNNCVFCFSDIIIFQAKIAILKTFFLNKSIYLDSIFRKKSRINTYILPNSSSITYLENIYTLPMLI